MTSQLAACDTSVWDDKPSNTIADKGFAPISVDYVSLDEPGTMYKRNNARMAMNSQNELTELQKHTKDETKKECVPFPNTVKNRQKPCRMKNDNESDGEERAEPEQHPDEEETDMSPSTHHVRFSTKMSHSIKGALYDLKHWKQLPPTKVGASRLHTLNYVMTRDDRLSYLIVWLFVCILVITLIGLIIGVSVKHRKRKLETKVDSMINKKLLEEMRRNSLPNMRR